MVSNGAAASSPSEAAAEAMLMPLMDPNNNGGGGEGPTENVINGRFVLLDVKEAKEQILFALPMILTNVFYYAITLTSVMFAGHLGQLQLAGATLGNSWATVTGFALMVGLSGALETLCGQAFGAELYTQMGLYLQASCIISFFFSILVSILWLYSESILILLGQEPETSKEAALFMKYLIPGLFAYGFLNNILRFLQTQSIVLPLVVCSVLPLLINLGLSYTLVHWAGLGFVGAPLAASISMWIAFCMLAIYVVAAKKLEYTWKGFSLQSFNFILTNLKLALPSAAMVCLEYWAFEILVLIAGLMPNSETSTSLIAICVNTEAIAYMFTYGLSATASTRVSNELGAGHPDRAKNSMVTTVELSFLAALAVISALAFGHNIWAGFFSDSSVIIASFSSMTPLLAISILLDSFQGVLSGVARGCGWQHLAAYANLATFYCVGMPIACLLAFKFKLHAKGLWIGLICGLFCQAGTLSVVSLRTKWNKLQLHTEYERSPILG